MTPALFEGNVNLHTILFAVVPTLVIAWLLAFVAGRLARRALVAVVGEHLSASSPLVRGPLRLVSFATFVLCAALLLFPAFELAGVRPRAGVPLKTLAEWAFGHGLKIVLIGLFAYALIRTTSLMVRRFEHEVSKGTTLDALERAKRARTLGSLVSNVTTIVISGLAVLMVLNEFGVNITPMLTGAGIAGLAVGFGAQTLVRDIISGFFMILEDQVRVGDSAAINGTGGLVEQINLRTIVLQRRGRHAARLPERLDHHARQPEQGLLVLRHHARDSVPRGSGPREPDPPGRRRRAAARPALRRLHPRADRDPGRGRLRRVGGRRSSCGSRPCRSGRAKSGGSCASESGARSTSTTWQCPSPSGSWRCGRARIHGSDAH